MPIAAGPVTLCHRGHARTPDNVAASGNCRACHAIYLREYRAKAPADRPYVRKTHCVNGHARTPDNVLKNYGCRQCSRDRANARNAAARQPRPERTHCKNGHLLDEDTRAPNGKCRQCARDSAARSRARRRVAPDTPRIAYDAERFPCSHLRSEHSLSTRNMCATCANDRRLARSADVETRYWIRLLRGDPCAYCGAPSAHVDHIIARSRGGSDHWTNYAAACANCNESKGARSLLLHMLQVNPSV